MKPLPRNVGYELEFSMPGDVTLENIARHMEDEDLPATTCSTYRHTPAYVSASKWDVKKDGSCGAEAASPILKTYEDLQKSVKACTIIKAHRCRSTTSCGLHVHVDMNNVSDEMIDNMMRFIVRYEPCFFQLVPGWRQNSMYCRQLTPTIIDTLRRYKGQWRDFNWTRVWGSKNFWVNMISMHSIGTMEFRIMVGTLNENFILGYVTFLMQIVDAMLHGKRIEWGQVKAKSQRDLFQTTLGQANFYGPFTDKAQALTGRAWALGQFKLVTGMEAGRDYQGDEYVSPKVPNLFKDIIQPPTPVPQPSVPVPAPVQVTPTETVVRREAQQPALAAQHYSTTTDRTVQNVWHWANTNHTTTTWTNLYDTAASAIMSPSYDDVEPLSNDVEPFNTI